MEELGGLSPGQVCPINGWKPPVFSTSDSGRMASVLDVFRSPMRGSMIANKR